MLSQRAACLVHSIGWMSRKTESDKQYLSLHLVMAILDLLDDLVPIAAEVTSSSRAVFLPCFQADPAEVILALQTTHHYYWVAVENNYLLILEGTRESWYLRQVKWFKHYYYYYYTYKYNSTYNYTIKQGKGERKKSHSNKISQFP